MTSIDKMTFSNTFLTIIAIAIIVMIIAVLFAIAIYQTNTDPHVNDEDYCQQYARGLDWRITANYAVDPAVAERVCSCTYHKFEGYTGNGTGPMYPGVYYCERR